jgi:hypothetical protein
LRWNEVKVGGGADEEEDDDEEEEKYEDEDATAGSCNASGLPNAAAAANNRSMVGRRV